MISVKEAEDIISQHSGQWGTELVQLSDSVGRVLEEDVFTDRSFPPFDRVTMDGIAIRREDFLKGIKNFKVIGVQMAGATPLTLDVEAKAIEVMTGAVMPPKADVVIRYEDVNMSSDDETKYAFVKSTEVKPNQNVHFKGSDHSEGARVLKRGTYIGAPEIGVLATVGKSEVKVRRMPKVAVISTGDEIVPVGHTPLDYQIRMSNSYSIKANLTELHRDLHCEIFHLKDDLNALLDKMRVILSEYDVLILSGGVSKGKADYIPEVLEKLGVEKHFHRVAQRPGKPFWFGTSKNGNCVFALPGNPVSTYTCFIRYVRPWLRASLSLSTDARQATLAEKVEFLPDLTYFLQVKTVDSSNTNFEVYKSAGNGSGDLSNMTSSTGIIELPIGCSQFEIGSIYTYYPFRTF